MAFPTTPTNGQQYTTNGQTYQWNNSNGTWDKVGTTTVPPTAIFNGNSNVKVDANSNITVSVAGNANVLTVTGTGIVANITGNVTGNVTGSADTVTTAAQPNITSVGTLTSLSVTGNANVGNLGSGGAVIDSKGDIRAVPQVTKTTAFVLTAAEAGKHVSTNANVTVPNGVFSIGDSVTILNNSAASITIIQGASVTMYQVGTANTGNRTLAQKGLATVFCYAANTFVITGGGLT